MNKLHNLFFGDKGQKKTILKNFIWLGTGQFGSRLIRSAITIYAARALGTAGYGVFSYAIGLTGFFVFFKNIGVDAILTREVARRPAERDQLFATSFWLEVGLLAVTAALLLFVAPILSHIPKALALIPALTVMLVADDMKDMFIAFFRGIEKMEWEAIVLLGTNITLVVFGSIAIWISATPLALALSYAAASLFGVLLSGGIIFARHIQGFLGKFDRKLVAPILISAWPIAVGGLASIFLFNLDIIMLGFWRTIDTVGIYAATQKIVGTLGVIPALVNISIFPVLSRFVDQKNPVRVREVMESTTRILSLFAIPLVLGGIVLSAPLLTLIFGAAYRSGATAMAVLLISIVASFPMALLTNFIFAYDRQKKTIFYPVLVSLINFFLNFLLIPRMGMVGASIATLVSNVVYTWLILRLSLRIEYFSIWKGLPKITGAAVPMAIFAWIMQTVGLNVVLNIIISAAVYFLTIKLLKEESLEEVISVIRS